MSDPFDRKVRNVEEIVDFLESLESPYDNNVSIDADIISEEDSEGWDG